MIHFDDPIHQSIMPQVSRRMLSKDVEGKITETLLEAVSQIRDKKEVSLFLNDLLTPTERIMVTKRLAIAILLLKGWGYDGVKDVLKVSSDTISRVALVLKMNNGYRIVVEKLLKTEAGREFWRDIVKLVHRIGTPTDAFADDAILNKKFGYTKKIIV